jgi:hypothetical protein
MNSKSTISGLMLLAMLSLSGCGKKLDGEYTNSGMLSGLVKMEFRDGKTVELSAPMVGHAVGEYKIKGEVVHLFIDGDERNYTIDDTGCINTDWGKMCPVGKSAAAD